MNMSDIQGSLSDAERGSVPWRWSYAVWPLWLVFTLAISTGYVFLLVLRATEFSEQEWGLKTPQRLESGGIGGWSVSQSAPTHSRCAPKTVWA